MEPRGTHGPLNTAVARVLSDAREASGLSTRELARAAGVPHRTMMRYLYDERAIDVERLYRLAVALGMTPHEVMIKAQALLPDADPAPADA